VDWRWTGNIALMAFGKEFVREHAVLMVLAIRSVGIGHIRHRHDRVNMTGHQRARDAASWSSAGYWGSLAWFGATWTFGLWEQRSLPRTGAATQG